MDTPILWPLNDLSVPIGPFETVSSLGVKTPIAGGTISGYLAASPSATSAADATWNIANLSYIGGANGYDVGWWLAQLDASVLTDALCEQHFAATGEAYLIGISANNIRVVVRLIYQRYRWASVAA